DKLRDTIENQGMIHVADRRGHYWIDPLEVFFEVHGRRPDRQPIPDEEDDEVVARNGRSVKRKGTEAEREFAKKIGGHRVPLSGATQEYKGDVEGLGLTWEVKRRKDGFAKLYEWLGGENIDALAIRADRKPWLVVMEVDTLLKLLGGDESAKGTDHRHTTEVDDHGG